MTTLTTAPLAPLLDRLFTQAEAARSPVMAAMPREERERLLRSRTDYLDFYSRLNDLWLAVSPETGRLLYMLARCTNAHTIVEFGTSFGISTLHLAAALRDNGGGHLVTTEFEPSKITRARQHITESGLQDLIELREGDALETLSHSLPETIDILLLDGAKSLYKDILTLTEKHLRPKALIIADNADFSPDYLAHVRNTENGYISVPFADDIELSLRLA